MRCRLTVAHFGSFNPDGYPKNMRIGSIAGRSRWTSHPADSNPAGAALEDMAVNPYRARRLRASKGYSLIEWINTSWTASARWLDYTTDGLRHEVNIGKRLQSKCQEESAASGQ